MTMRWTTDETGAANDGGGLDPAERMYVAGLLNGFFEAGWSIQVLLGDMDEAEFRTSRLARPAILDHLRNMSGCARELPPSVRDQMPDVDWLAWESLAAVLPPRTHAHEQQVWTVLQHWLGPAGQALRRYRRRLPALWQLFS
jgi:uncharacterized protein with HEPN domain